MVQCKDLNVQNLGKEVKTTQKYTVNKSNNGLSMVPWGTKNQVILTGNNIAQGTFNATKQVSVGKDVYLYGTINNRTGWVNAKDLTAPTAVKPTTSAAKDYNYTYVIKNGNGYYYVTPNSDTANDRSTINGEISYMKNNYQNAFVHAFVDGDRIIETAPTDYLSWGVGAVR
ncbi:autolysin [Staphylococcus aureus]|nr:autolysin [Staphylococcus aureus]